MSYEKFSKGSEWRKCDLHIHTPFSNNTNYGNKEDASIWNSFIDDIKNSYEIDSMLGINDYNSFEGYFKILDDYPDLAKQYKLFPVIELRTDDYVGKNADSKIDLHIILSDNISKDELESILDEPLTSQGRKIKEISDNEPICMEKLKNFFIEHNQYYKNKFFLMLGKNEADKIDNGIKGDYMRYADFMCSASETIEKAKKVYTDVQEYYSNKYRIRYIHCSDAHNFSKITNETTRKIGHCFTWIKGKPCFETIRQALFSYDTRIKISKDKPSQAVNVLDKVIISLPDASTIGDNDSCFAGQNIELSLNPALNCFIGGRGTGKSLLLQLFCKNNKENLPQDDNNIVNKIVPKNWEDCVTIDGIDFEYFGQGTIEKFYENREQFKKSVSDRLYKFWETEDFITDGHPTPFTEKIRIAKEKLEEKISIIKEQFNLLSHKIENDNNIKKLEKEIATRKKIIETFNDDVYKKLSEDITLISKRVSFIDSSKRLFETLFRQISSIIKDSEAIEEKNNEDIAYYAKKYNALLTYLNKILKQDVSTDWIKEDDTRASLKTKEDELKTYFESRGMSKLNIYDAALAKKEFDNLTNQINKLKDDNKKSEQDIETLKNEIMSVNNEYSNTMKIILDKTADILKQKGSSEISRLTFKYDTDKLKMFNDMCEFVKTYTNVDKNDFESILKRRTKEQKEVDLMSDILESICEESSDLKSSKKILSFFEVNPRNKKLYDLHYLSCKYNEAKYEMFSIMYQNKELENLSFGQRATAIILTLLLFGNKPLVIDEPETHLDQKLIALELINVIKQVKSDKQIVFATHNANIVINGDSEQIYILKTEPTSNKTSFIQMSIEDMCEKSRQSDLLMLEGSVEAFKHREQKYSLPKDDNCPLK